MKKTRESISKKYAAEDSPSNDKSLLCLSAAVTKILDSKGLAYKWINQQEHTKTHGFNPDGWTPFKFEGKVEGVDAEGYLRRKELVLATIPREEQRKLIAKNKRRTEALSNFNSEIAKELRQIARQADPDAKVFEGYEENDTD